MKKISLFIILSFLCFLVDAQPNCSGTLGEPILNLTFGQGNATQSAYSPLAAYAPGLSTNTFFQTSGFLGGANTSGLVKNTSIFGPSPYWTVSSDHTGDANGLLLGLNMPDNIGDTVIEYEMTGLCSNTTLQFSIWLLNLMDPNHPSVLNGSFIEYPNMIMRIVDPANNLLASFSTGDVPHDGVWHQYAVLFSNGNNSTVKLQLINNTSGSSAGNDVALDDITVRPCVPVVHILPKLDTTLCQSKSISFTANITAGAYSSSNYQWQYSTDHGVTWINGSIPSANNSYTFPFAPVSASAEYWIRYLVSPGNFSITTNCHAVSDTSIIRIDTIGKIQLPDDTTMCPNASLKLNAIVPDAISYLWNTGATTSTIQINVPGTYQVTASSLYGCLSHDSTHVTISQSSNPDLGQDTAFCQGQQYTLSVSGLGADHYLWNTGSTDSIIQVNSSGLYWVKTDFDECVTSDSVLISFNEYPTANLGIDTTICEGSQIILHSTTDYDNASYLWSTGSSSHMIAVEDPGKYLLTITNHPICSSSDSITIKTSRCNCDLIIPNAFSPNGDGLNDDFKPILIHQGCPLNGYRLYIYNRWGALVFSSFNPQHSWNGTIHNKNADVGTYMYYVAFTDWISQKERSYKGDLTLIR